MAIQRILVATDFSPCATHALEFALTLAQKQDARITVLHAWNAPPIVSAVDVPPLIELPGLPGVTLVDFVKRDAEREMQKLAGDLEARGVKGVETRLVFADARTAIVEDSEAYDLVVMGTHGRGGLARVLLGSVADYVVRHARCAVLTVRPRA